MWPTYTYVVSTAVAAPIQSKTLTSSALTTTGSAAPNTALPTVSSCYTASVALTANTLTNQAPANCPTGSVFCQVICYNLELVLNFHLTTNKTKRPHSRVCQRVRMA